VEIILSLTGIGIGILSGFFGMGGGTVLVPILLLLGFEMRVAVGISIIQMTFSSIFGSYINYRKGSLIFDDGLMVGFGGFVGGYLSGYLTAGISERNLQYVFIFFILFALYRLYTSPKENDIENSKSVSKFILFIVGIGIGIISISIGVGGAIILIPILSGFLHYPFKKAVSAGLFFVVFSSISGLIGRLVYGEIDLYHGLIIGISSLLGVYLGILLKEKIHSQKLKYFTIIMYLIILIVMIYKIFK